MAGWLSILGEARQKSGRGAKGKNKPQINVTILQPPGFGRQMMYSGAGPDGVVQPDRPAMMNMDSNPPSIIHEGEGMQPFPGGMNIIPAKSMQDQERMSQMERQGLPGYQTGGTVYNDPAQSGIQSAKDAGYLPQNWTPPQKTAPTFTNPGPTTAPRMPTSQLPQNAQQNIQVAKDKGYIPENFDTSVGMYGRTGQSVTGPTSAAPTFNVPQTVTGPTGQPVQPTPLITLNNLPPVGEPRTVTGPAGEQPVQPATPAPTLANLPEVPAETPQATKEDVVNNALDVLQGYMRGDDPYMQKLFNNLLQQYDARTAENMRAEAMRIAADPNMTQGAKTAAMARMMAGEEGGRAKLVSGLANEALDRQYGAAQDVLNQGQKLREYEDQMKDTDWNRALNYYDPDTPEGLKTLQDMYVQKFGGPAPDLNVLKEMRNYNRTLRDQQTTMGDIQIEQGRINLDRLENQVGTEKYASLVTMANSGATFDQMRQRFTDSGLTEEQARAAYDSMTEEYGMGLKYDRLNFDQAMNTYEQTLQGQAGQDLVRHVDAMKIDPSFIDNWQQDPTTTQKLQDLWSAEGNQGNWQDSEAGKNWAGRMIRSAHAGAADRSIAEMQSSDWYKNLPPEEQQDLLMLANFAAEMAFTGGNQAVYADKAMEIDGRQYQEGDLIGVKNSQGKLIFGHDEEGRTVSNSDMPIPPTGSQIGDLFLDKEGAVYRKTASGTSEPVELDLSAGADPWSEDANKIVALGDNYAKRNDLLKARSEAVVEDKDWGKLSGKDDPTYEYMRDNPDIDATPETIDLFSGGVGELTNRIGEGKVVKARSGEVYYLETVSDTPGWERIRVTTLPGGESDIYRIGTDIPIDNVPKGLNRFGLMTLLQNWTPNL